MLSSICFIKKNNIPLSTKLVKLIEHSDNKSITKSGLFGNEIGPGVLQSKAQQTRLLQECQRHKPCATDYVSILSLLCEIFADCVFVEHWTGALQVPAPFLK